MLNFSKIIRIVTHVVVTAIALLVFYYLKYRPIRNECQATKAANIELRKQVEAKDLIIDAVWTEYYKLAKVPRYSIDQHLDRIKVKRNASLDFVPAAAMTITDSVKLQEGDSIIVNTKMLRQAQHDSAKYRQHWWQFWRKRKK